MSDSSSSSSASSSATAAAGKARIDAIIEKAFAQRIKGNECFKNGDTMSALKEYHAVLLQLKGLDSSITTIYPRQTPGMSDGRKSTTDEGDVLGKVKNAVMLTYLNTAAIHIKNQKFKRALESATEAAKLDEANTKVKFRIAQAHIGLGEVHKGKKLLLELQKIKPDIAITTALKQLAIEEKEGQIKGAQQFKGMYDKKPPTPSTPSTPSSSSSTNTSKPIPADRNVRATLTELIDSDEEEEGVRREPVASTSAIPSD